MKINDGNRTTGKALDSLAGVRIEAGRVVNIYPERGTVDFRSEMSEQYRYDIPCATPYYDQVGASGFYANPEVGTTAICVTTSEDKSFILAFMGVDEEGSYLCGRPQGNPGDIFITGRDDNFLAVRRGGIIQIGSTPIAQTVYIPTRNIIQNFCENFGLYSIAGEMTFNVDRPEDSAEGHSKCTYTLKANEYADDKSSIADLQLGSQEGNLIFSLITRDSGGGSIKIKLTGDKEGNLNISLEKTLSMNVRGDIIMTAEGKFSAATKGNIEFDSKGDIKMKGVNFSVKGTGTGEIISGGPLAIKAPTIKITDKGLYPVLRMSPDMATLLGACVALTKVPAPANGINPSVLV
jgi:hypothetical protein